MTKINGHVAPRYSSRRWPIIVIAMLAGHVAIMATAVTLASRSHYDVMFRTLPTEVAGAEAPARPRTISYRRRPRLTSTSGTTRPGPSPETRTTRPRAPIKRWRRRPT